MQLKGIHHVSSLTANARRNVDFYTNVLGMRLVKKTVNQDDTSVYHLFYGDERGNPGTEVTFFEIPMAASNKRGTNSITNVSLRVPGDDALEYWKQRFEEHAVQHSGIQKQAGRLVLPFEDPEGHRMQFVSDEYDQGVEPGVPWELSNASPADGATGLGPVRLTVKTAEPTAAVLKDIMGFSEIHSYPHPDDADLPDIRVFETGKGGSGAEIHIETRNDLPAERQGRGAVHHVAFRVEDADELQQWIERIKNARLPNSGFVERYYFQSLYFREPNGILFELATDGPGFEGDEPFEHLGESLALPPFLEPQRSEIEARLKPLD